MADEERLLAITACVEQIHEAITAQRPGDWLNLLWECDQRAELHRLLYENGNCKESTI